jgi:hypothetical protein
MKRLFVCLLCFAFFSVNRASARYTQGTTAGDQADGKAGSDKEQFEDRDIVLKRNEWFYGQRAYPLGFIPAGARLNALAELDQIDRSGMVWNCWTGALARLGVARANALQAKNATGSDADAARVRALAGYKDFLTLWKDADPNIPIYQQAKAEYAKLK